MHFNNRYKQLGSAAVDLRAAGMLIGLCLLSLSSWAEDDSVRVFLPGDQQFQTPEFEPYEALYNSGSSSTGAFTLRVRHIPQVNQINMIDIIPTSEGVITAQRTIDATSHRSQFSAGPFFAWGPAVVVQHMTAEQYDWSRVPIGGGEPVRMQGEWANGGVVSVMFSPTLASLMPLPVETEFKLPLAVPRRNETVESGLTHYKVLRREQLELDSGIGCHCWVIEQAGQGGGVDHLWVAREAPFVFRRHRDVGGQRELVSEVLEYRVLKR